MEVGDPPQIHPIPPQFAASPYYQLLNLGRGSPPWLAADTGAAAKPGVQLTPTFYILLFSSRGDPRHRARGSLPGVRGPDGPGAAGGGGHRRRPGLLHVDAVLVLTAPQNWVASPQLGLTHPRLGTRPEPPSASQKHPADRDAAPNSPPHPPPCPGFCIK